MIQNCKLCWGISLLLFIAIISMMYMSFIRGSVTSSDDGRTAVVLTAGERNFVLGEMRAFLEGVQEIAESLSKKDIKSVVTAAQRFGAGNDEGAPKSLMLKLPLKFRKLAKATHKGFADIVEEGQGSVLP
jgi:hypothetical protein